MIVSIGARRSPLSRAQVKEIYQELKTFYPEIQFDVHYVDTTGDIDLETSLRSLDRTDFFTKEIDHLIQKGQCRAGVHSAKDLPENLGKDLTIAAITEGVDPADVLVLRDHEQLKTLPKKAKIATSSERREEAVKKLRDDLTFVDIRGNIQSRLDKLFSGEVDGVVIAEAALLRLELTHLNRVRLPGLPAPLQGQLAVVVRIGDKMMLDLFSCLDSRDD